MVTGCLTLQTTLTCRNMKVWSDAMKTWAHNNRIITGDWVFGAKTGVGKSYYPSGSLLFYGRKFVINKTSPDEFCLSGNLSDGLPHGLGTHYYENGNILFRGETVSSSDQSEGLHLTKNQSETK